MIEDFHMLVYNRYGMLLCFGIPWCGSNYNKRIELTRFCRLTTCCADSKKLLLDARLLHIRLITWLHF